MKCFEEFSLINQSYVNLDYACASPFSPFSGYPRTVSQVHSAWSSDSAFMPFKATNKKLPFEV